MRDHQYTKVVGHHQRGHIGHHVVVVHGQTNRVTHHRLSAGRTKAIVKWVKARVLDIPSDAVACEVTTNGERTSVQLINRRT